MLNTTTTSAEQSRTGPVSFTDNPGAMAAVTTIFFMWGLITVLNDILIPHLKAIFKLDYAQAMLIQFCFFGAYFVFSVPFGKVVERIGYQKTMVLGLCISGIGALLFLPAAQAASFPLFLGALIVLATGITGLQVSANPYVSVLGPPATASSRLNLAQALNSLGTTIAPYVGGILILGGANAVLTQAQKTHTALNHLQQVQQAHSVILPYLVLAAVLFALALFTALFRLPRMEEQSTVAERSERHGSIWQYRHTLLGALGIFLYVGAEVSIGSFLVNYFSRPDTGGLTALTAAKWVSYYWGGAMVGRFLGSAILQRVRPDKALGANACIAGLLVITSMLTFGHVAMITILLVGLFNSIMFPNIFTLGIAGLGPLTGEGSGLLIAAIVGGAIIPLAQGVLADHIGIHHAFILPVLCYIYIAYYGFKGSRPTAPKIF